MMPQSAQNLYFHLGMNADDDGFCEHFAIMRMTASNPDDLSVLIVKGFVHAFDEKVLVILDWKENNYLRSDRYTPSNYLETYKEDLLSLEEKGKQTLLFGIPDGRQSATQDRIGKDRIGNRDDVKISGSEQLVDIPKWIDPNVWEEWCQYRKQIKKKLTPLSAKKQIEFLGKYKSIYVQIINQSIQNGWTGLFPLKDKVVVDEEPRGWKVSQEVQDAMNAPRTTQDNANLKRFQNIKKGIFKN